MAVSNSLTKQAQKPKFTAVINSEGYRRMICNTLGDTQKASRFVTAVTSAVSSNPALQECDAGTIVAAGLLGEGLALSPSPQLGQYYLVPFNDNKNNRKVAQFQLGYKGYIQLAIRSGQYKKLNVLPIKEGELIRFDPLEEEIEVRLIDDEVQRENAQTTGYYAMFEYTNGFKKAMYWSREKMQSHAEKYSKGYAAHKGHTFWEKDFDGMACKTMLRQLISKWGIMSIDMQTAMTNDMGVIHEDGSVDHVDMISVQSVQPAEDIPENTEREQETKEQADFNSIMGG